MWLEFSPEEGSIGQYESPGEKGGKKGRRDEEGGRTQGEGLCYLLRTRGNRLVGQDGYIS